VVGAKMLGMAPHPPAARAILKIVLTNPNARSTQPIPDTPIA